MDLVDPAVSGIENRNLHQVRLTSNGKDGWRTGLGLSQCCEQAEDNGTQGRAETYKGVSHILFSFPLLLVKGEGSATPTGSLRAAGVPRWKGPQSRDVPHDLDERWPRIWLPCRAELELGDAHPSTFMALFRSSCRLPVSSLFRKKCYREIEKIFAFASCALEAEGLNEGCVGAVETHPQG